MQQKNLTQITRDKRFDSILDQHEAKVFRLVYGLVCNYHDAEEVTQEVFLKIYEKLDTFHGNSDISFWINKIARNNALNFLRRKALIRFISLDWLSDNHKEFEDLSELGSPKNVAEHQLEMELLDNTLKKLPIKYREILVLSEIQELSYNELSTLLNVPIGTIKSRLSRAKELLKKTIKGGKR